MRHILVVDDSYTIREMVAGCIKDQDNKIIRAADGIEALAIAKTTRFDLVITDINMPNMDGLTLVEKLRKLPHYKKIPLLVLATESDPNMKKKASDLGVTGWILKPINQDAFASIIDKVMQRSEK